jgi:hypothetical protein
MSVCNSAESLVAECIQRILDAKTKVGAFFNTQNEPPHAMICLIIRELSTLSEEHSWPFLISKPLPPRPHVPPLALIDFLFNIFILRALKTINGRILFLYTSTAAMLVFN